MLGGIAGFLGLFAGLCTIFVLVVTVVEAWQEHAEAQWPEVIAHVDRCYMRQSDTQRNRYHIDCRLSYTVGAEHFVAGIYSTSAPGPEVWQYPPNQIAPFQDWVDAHPRGTLIVVRYDPANHKKAVLAVNDLPHGGPHARNNLKMLGVVAAICVVLLTIAQIARPRPAEMPDPNQANHPIE
jgi:Protein of unknown function (DUF3592)